jgi:hypothetical protein
MSDVDDDLSADTAKFQAFAQRQDDLPSCSSADHPSGVAGGSVRRPRPFGIIGNVNPPDGERERLTALGGLAALSLDALSSVAYGPEAILVVLVTAGVSALKYSLPITGAIVVLLAALVISYRQVIEAFPNGGGAYAVSSGTSGRCRPSSRRPP